MERSAVQVASPASRCSSGSASCGCPVARIDSSSRHTVAICRRTQRVTQAAGALAMGLPAGALQGWRFLLARLHEPARNLVRLDLAHVPWHRPLSGVRVGGTPLLESLHRNKDILRLRSEHLVDEALRGAGLSVRLGVGLPCRLEPDEEPLLVQRGSGSAAAGAERWPPSADP